MGAQISKLRPKSPLDYVCCIAFAKGADPPSCDFTRRLWEAKVPLSPDAREAWRFYELAGRLMFGPMGDFAGIDYGTMIPVLEHVYDEKVTPEVFGRLRMIELEISKKRNGQPTTPKPPAPPKKPGRREKIEP